MNNGVSWKAINGCALEKDTLYTMNNGVSWKEINRCALERVWGKIREEKNLWRKNEILKKRKKNLRKPITRISIRREECSKCYN